MLSARARHAPAPSLRSPSLGRLGSAWAVAARGRVGRAFAVVVLIFLAAASAYEGFYGKWALRDGSPAMSMTAMLDGTAYRPYVYRRLAPDAATVIEGALPAAVRERLTEVLLANGPRLGVDGADATRRDYTLRYFLVYFGGFAAFLGALGALYALCRTVASPPPSAAATAGFAVLFPVLQSVGGYVYDFSELLFLASAFLLCAQGGRAAWLVIPLAALATLNKESFFFYLPALLPLLWASAGPRRAFPLLALAGGASLAVYAAVRARYAGNPGGTVEHHLLENVAFYADPRSLLRFEGTYGLPLFAGFSLVTLLLVAVFAAVGWRGVGAPVRRHLLLAALINVPLLLLFCAPGETRNLSLLFPGLVLLMAAAFERWTTTPEPIQ